MAIVDIAFTRPDFLWYLISIPFIFLAHFIMLARTKKKAMRFANFEALQRVSKDRLLTKNWTILLLRVGVIFCLILAISGTVVWYEGKSNMNDFVLAMDMSASMAAQDVQPTRFEAARNQADLFVRSLKTDARIGVVAFSGVPFVVQVPTDNRDEALQAIDGLAIETSGGTDIGGAIITGTNLLLPSNKGRTIILLTDGSNTAGTFTENPVQHAVNYALLNHVKVDTIGVGTNAGPVWYLPEYYNISAVFDASELISISNQTHGEFYRASNSDEIAKAYTAISGQAEDALLSFDMSYGLLLIALMLLFIEWGLINTRFRNIP